MLTDDDRKTVETILDEMVRRGDRSAAETGSILARLPADPQATQHLMNLARERNLPWIVYVARAVDRIQQSGGLKRPDVAADPPTPPVVLDAVLSSDAPYPAKVDALLAALRGTGPATANTIRRFIREETNPFVLATMISALGQCGDESDRDYLLLFLDHTDERVVANTLEALHRRRIVVDAERLIEFVRGNDNRIRTNALALLGRSDPSRVLELVRSLLQDGDATTRVGLAYVLGDLAENPDATTLLVDFFLTEERTPVLKHVVQSVRKHLNPINSSTIIGTLSASRDNAAPAKRALIDMLLQEIAPEYGLVESQVRELGRSYSRTDTPPMMASLEDMVHMPPPLEPGDRPSSGPVRVSTSARWTAPVASGRVPNMAAPGDSSVSPGRGTNLAIATGRLRAVATDPPEDTDSSTPWFRQTWPYVATGAAMLWWYAFAGARPAQPPEPVAHASARAQVTPSIKVQNQALAVLDPKQLESYMGPMNAPITVVGTVVGSTNGQPIVRSESRYYLILNNPVPTADEIGATLRASGKIAGTVSGGLTYVDVRGQ